MVIRGRDASVAVCIESGRNTIVLQEYVVSYVKDGGRWEMKYVDVLLKIFECEGNAGKKLSLDLCLSVVDLGG